MTTIIELMNEKYNVLKSELSKYDFDKSYFIYDVQTLYYYAKTYYFDLDKEVLKTQINSNIKDYITQKTEIEKTEILSLILNFVLFLKSIK
jgi:hypothetical protein